MRILSPNESAGIYVPVHTSWLCIGYDGLGAIDGAKSDVTAITGAKFTENPIFEEMHLADVETTPQIHMRRAVRRFDCYYGDQHNLLILSDRAFALAGHEFESTINCFSAVECHFGSWSGRYFLCKLRRQAILYNEAILAPESTFVKVNSLSHHQSLIEKGERDPNDESHIVQRGLRFDTTLQAIQAKDFGTDILLDDATLDFPKVAMFNYKAGVSYLSLSIYQQLLTLKHPQRQVLGIVGSQPFAKVHFAPA